MNIAFFPTRDASPPLEVAFCGSGIFTILQILYLPSILHLTLTRCNSLTVNALLSVRCYKFHLHATYTTHDVATRTSTGGRCHGIGEQKGLLLRQIVLRPYAVLSTAYVQTDCVTGGEVCKMYAGVCKILWNHLTLLKSLYINLLRTKSVRWQ